MLAPLGHRRQRQREHHERRQPERDVDVEDPAPARMACEEAADQRAGDARHAEDGAEQPQVAPALARRHDVADRRLRTHQQAAAAEPLDRPEHDQLGHALREAAEGRADEEEHERALQHDLAPIEVAELPVQRRHDRDRQQVGRHDPRDVIEPAEVADDGRERGRDDRLVERREQHREHERGDHDEHAPPLRHVRRRGPGGLHDRRQATPGSVRRPGSGTRTCSLAAGRHR